MDYLDRLEHQYELAGEDLLSFVAAKNLIEDAYIEICATCVFPDNPYQDGAFPQLENPKDAECLANTIAYLYDALQLLK